MYRPPSVSGASGTGVGIGGANYGQSSACSSETANRILALRLQLEMEQRRRLDVERALADYARNGTRNGASGGLSGGAGGAGRSALPLPPLTEGALSALEARMSSSRRGGNGSSRRSTGGVNNDAAAPFSIGANASAPSGTPRGSAGAYSPPPLEGEASFGRRAASSNLPKAPRADRRVGFEAASSATREGSVGRGGADIPIPAPPTADARQRFGSHQRARSANPSTDVDAPPSPSASARQQLKEGRATRKPPLPREAKPLANACAVSRFGKQRSCEVDIYLARQRHEARMAALRAFEL